MSGNQEEFIQVPKGQHELHSRSAALLSQLLGDPRTAADAERLVAQVNPQAQFPDRARREALLQPVMGELEKERAARAALEARLTAREEKEAAREQQSQEAALTARLAAVRDRRGFSEETMGKVIQRMRDQNNPDVDAAAAWVAESVPKPPPATGHDFLPTGVDVYGSQGNDKKWESLHANPDRWLTQELRNISADPEFARLGAVA